jgi:uncharacterized membrane protein YhhN
MKNKSWLYIFLLVLLADLICIQIQNNELQYVFKSLIIPVLASYFVSQTRTITTALKKWILLALFFSWAGDIILMFQDKQELFFLLGLGSFLLAHVFYIVFFHNIRVKENVKSNILLLLPVVIYYAFLISWLSPYLGDKKIPVRIYGIVISFMLLLALHMMFIKNKTAGRLMLFGALLFVISDSILAINKFYESFEAAGILIMLSYGLAQLFIVQGAIKYIRERTE